MYQLHVTCILNCDTRLFVHLFLFISPGRGWRLPCGTIIQSKWINTREARQVGNALHLTVCLSQNKQNVYQGIAAVNLHLPPSPNWAPQASDTRSPASLWSLLVTSCGLSSVTKREVILLVIPLLTRPLLVGTEAYHSMGWPYFQKAEVEGSSLSFLLNQNYKYSPLTLDKKSLIFLIS